MDTGKKIALLLVLALVALAYIFFTDTNDLWALLPIAILIIGVYLLTRDRKSSRQ